eukprot:456392-Pyramimonas_sp.AAC.1
MCNVPNRRTSGIVGRYLSAVRHARLRVLHLQVARRPVGVGAHVSRVRLQCGGVRVERGLEVPRAVEAVALVLEKDGLAVRHVRRVPVNNRELVLALELADLLLCKCERSAD